MTACRDLARELLLTKVSIATHCQTREIATYRRLPEGARGGHLVAHVTDRDAKRIRAYYADRLAGRRG